jgi:Leucine-rich repeat (LRR) protein
MEDKDIQKEDIQTCKELLEIEPSCKWALITLLWYDTKKEEYIQSLLSMDTLHEGYYRDVWSDEIISKMISSSSSIMNLSNLSLTRMNKINEFKELKSVDLSNNDILFIPELKGCPFLEYLNLNNNKIEFLEGVSHLENLQTLLLKNNSTMIDELILGNIII